MRTRTVQPNPSRPQAAATTQAPPLPIPPPRPRAGPYAHSGDNARTFVNAWPEGERGGIVVSTDPADRCHKMKDSCGMLIPAAVEDDRGWYPNPDVAAKPRRYPAANCVGIREVRTALGPVLQGTPHDSMFDAWWKRARRLTAAGIPVGAGTPTLGEQVSHADRIRRRDVTPKDGETRILRNYVSPRLRVRIPREDRELVKSERQLSRAATRILLRATRTGQGSQTPGKQGPA